MGALGAALAVKAVGGNAEQIVEAAKQGASLATQGAPGGSNGASGSAAAGGSAGSADAGAPFPTGTLRCASGDTELNSSGYQCMSYRGKAVPGKYDITALHGSWVADGYGICVTWGSDGRATTRFKPAILGGGPARTSAPDVWGVVSRSSGAPEVTQNGAWLVYTAAGDDQMRLMYYHSDRDAFHPFELKRGACPW